MAKSIELGGVKYTKLQLKGRINEIKRNMQTLEFLYNKTVKPEIQEREIMFLGETDDIIERQNLESQLMSAEKLLNHLENVYRKFDTYQ